MIATLPVAAALDVRGEERRSEKCREHRDPSLTGHRHFRNCKWPTDSRSAKMIESSCSRRGGKQFTAKW
jgi:hypothetical protein